MRIISRALGVPVSANANVSTAQVFQTSTGAYILPILGDSRFTNKQFLVRASGRLTTGTTTNVTITLQSGTSTTAGSNTIILASTARALNTASSNWFLTARLILDLTSGKLNGVVEFCVNNLYDIFAAATQVAGFTADAEPLVQLVANVTFSAANAGNIATIDEFVAGF